MEEILHGGGEEDKPFIFDWEFQPTLWTFGVRYRGGWHEHALVIGLGPVVLVWSRNF